RYSVTVANSALVPLAPRLIMFSTVASHWARVRLIDVACSIGWQAVPQTRLVTASASGATVPAGDDGRGWLRPGGGWAVWPAAAVTTVKATADAARVQRVLASARIGGDYTGRAYWRCHGFFHATGSHHRGRSRRGASPARPRPVGPVDEP